MASLLTRVFPLPTLLLAAGVATMGLTVGVAVVPGTASGQPRPTLAAVQRQLVVLERDQAVARGRYAATVRAVQTADARLKQVTAGVAAAEAKLSRVRQSVGELAAANYRTGGTNPLLRLLLAEDPDTLLRSAEWVEQTADYQADALRRVATTQADLDRDRSVHVQELARVTAARAASAAQQQKLVQQAAKIRTLLASLQVQERKRLAAARPGEYWQSAAIIAGGPGSAAGRTAPRLTNGSCPHSGSRGAEAQLKPAALWLMRCGLAAFPQIQFAGGWGIRANATDHDDGRAVDLMIPNYRSAAGNDLGWAVAEWATKQPNVSYVLFDQMSYGSWNGGWERMSNRGSDTANHRDHVHVSLSQ